MLGLSGFTVTCSNREFTTKSMSSSGIEPSNTFSPSTKAPVKHERFSKRTCTGPTYGTSVCRPSATVTSRRSSSSKP